MLTTPTANETTASTVRTEAHLRDAGRPVVIVAGAIAPYTNRLYEAYGARGHGELSVLVCVDVEPQRKWAMPVATRYALKVLPGLRRHLSDLRNIYFNPTVIIELARTRPSAIFLGAFSPTMLLAGLYAIVTRTPLGIMTDGSVEMDPGRWSRIHRWLRHLLIPRAVVGIGSSANSGRLLAHYGLEPERIHLMPIVPPWPAPAEVPGYDARPYDVLFCGALEDTRKGAGFFTDVVIEAARRGRRLAVRVAGDGPLRQAMEARMADAGIAARFDGYVQPDRLPEVYASAKCFLFPSRGDPWGLVANEAVQCGTPIVGSPHAVSSHELVERFEAGTSVPLEVPLWVVTLFAILDDRQRWQHHHHARERAQAWLSLDNAVDALARAINQACKARKGR
ncbi:MAG: glycosyltransferase family 4 protein [Hyphomicrobiaceae bacterium]